MYLQSRPLLVALALIIVLLAISTRAWAVPLADWQPDEDKLLGKEAVSRADLPDEWQALSDEDLRAKMAEVYSEADNHYFASEFQAALPLYQQCLNYARLLSDQVASGIALNDIGLVYDSLSQRGQALSYYEPALAIEREIGDRIGEGTTLNCIGVVYHELSQNEQALSYYEQALAIRREVGDRIGEGTTLNNIGGVYDDLGQHEQALSFYKQALAIGREAGDRKGEGTTTNNIGLVYDELSQYEQALSYYEQALAIGREVENPIGEGITLNNIGNVYDQLYQYKQALSYHEQALAISRAAGDRSGEGSALNNIGLVYYHLSQYEQALINYEQALAIKREVGDRSGEGTMLNNIGAVDDELSQYEQALINYEQALAIKREVGDRYGEGFTLNNIGWIYDNIKQYELALSYYEQALAIQRKVGDYSLKGTILNNIGRMHCNTGKYDAASDAFATAFKIATSQATQFTWESGIKGGLNAYLAAEGSLWAQVQLKLSQPESAFATFQSAKGAPLLALLAQAQVQNQDPEVQAKLDAYRNANAARQANERQLYAITEDDPDAASKREYEQAQIEQYQAQANNSWDWLKEHDPRLTEMISVKGLSVEQVQQQVLKPGQVVLEYMYVSPDDVLPEPAQPGAESAVVDSGASNPEPGPATNGAESGATAASPGADSASKSGKLIIFCLPWEGELTVAQVPLSEATDGVAFDVWLNGQLQNLFSKAEGDAHNAAKQLAKRQSASRALYDLLVTPVADAIPAAGPDGGEIELIVCPDGELYRVPFEALMDPAGQYLLEQYPLRYSTSATMLSYLLEPEPGQVPGPPLVAGVTFGAAGDGTELVPEPCQSIVAEMVHGLFRSGELQPLPGVAAETAEVAEKLGVTRLLDAQVTEPAMRAALPGHAVVHLATHGLIDRSPLLNGIVLYQEPAAESAGKAVGGGAEAGEFAPDIAQRDGFLRMGEVMGLNLRGTELVTLSCCHTAQGAEGEVPSGEGVMGLTQGFIYAGARGVLASLDKVDDAATRTLMEAFYHHWCEEGLTKTEALHQAKLDLLQGAFPDPVYWSLFVLYGSE